MRLFAFAPLVIWIGVILVLGSGPGSMAQTSRFIRPLIEFLFPDASPDTFLLVHAFIRKCAHFVEYALLALLACRACLFSKGSLFHKYWWIYSLLLVAVVAGIDEFNQSFYSSRTSSPWDVALDVTGGVFGVVCAALLLRWKQRREITVGMPS